MRRIAAAVLAVALLPARPPAGTSYAFLVACQDYDVKQLRKLNYPRADILALRDALTTSAGFEERHVKLM